MKIFPGMHYTWADCGRLQTADEHPGIFAAGEAEYQYHGANRLGANSLMSCIYGGFISGPNASSMRRACKPRPATLISMPNASASKTLTLD